MVLFTEMSAMQYETLDVFMMTARPKKGRTAQRARERGTVPYTELYSQGVSGFTLTAAPWVLFIRNICRVVFAILKVK